MRPGEDGGLWKVGVGIGTITGRGPGQTDDGWDPAAERGRAAAACLGARPSRDPRTPGTPWDPMGAVGVLEAASHGEQARC